MRILMLHNDYAQAGGEYFSVRAEHESLRRRGLDARLVTVANDAVIRQHGTRRLAVETIRPRLALGAVAEALEGFRPDLVHVQNLFPLMGGGLIDLLQEQRLPWIRTLRNYRLRCIAGTCFRDGSVCTDCTSASRGVPGIRHSCYRGSVPASIGAVAYARSEHRASEKHPASAFILLSQAMRPLLADMLGKAKVYVKPNSVPGEARLSPTPRANRVDEFLFVGRFSPEKGLSPLIDEFSRSPELRLSLVGGGSLSHEDAEKVRGSDNISLLGELPNDAVLSRMRSALAVVVPSQWAEPFGRVAAEALAAGTPAIVMDRGGMSEIVTPISPALVVRDGGSWVTAAHDIRGRVASDYDGLALRAVERWETTYDERVVGDQLVDIYREVLSDLRQERDE
jgi:glycosyltransferase involved in cell wall biosynthesis